MSSISGDGDSPAMDSTQYRTRVLTQELHVALARMEAAEASAETTRAACKRQLDGMAKRVRSLEEQAVDDSTANEEAMRRLQRRLDDANAEKALLVDRAVKAESDLDTMRVEHSDVESKMEAAAAHAEQRWGAQLKDSRQSVADLTAAVHRVQAELEASQGDAHRLESELQEKSTSHEAALDVLRNERDAAAAQHATAVSVIEEVVSVAQAATTGVAERVSQLETSLLGSAPPPAPQPPASNPEARVEFRLSQAMQTLLMTVSRLSEAAGAVRAQAVEASAEVAAAHDGRDDALHERVQLLGAKEAWERERVAMEGRLAAADAGRHAAESRHRELQRAHELALKEREGLEAERSRLVTSVDEAHSKIARLEAGVEATTREVASRSSTSDELRRQVDALQAEVKAADLRVVELEQQRNFAAVETAKAKEDAASWEAKFREASASAGVALGQLKDATRRADGASQSHLAAVDRVNDLTASLAEAEARLQGLTVIPDLRARLGAAEAGLEAARAGIADAKDALASERALCAALKEQVVAASAVARKEESASAGLKADVEAARGEAADVRAKLEALQAEATAQRAGLVPQGDVERANQGLLASREELATAKEQLAAARREAAAARDAASALQGRLDDTAAQLADATEQLQVERGRVRAQAEIKSMEGNMLREALATQQAEVARLSAAAAEADARLGAAQADTQAAVDANHDLRRRLAAAENDVTRLTEGLQGANTSLEEALRVKVATDEKLAAAVAEVDAAKQHVSVWQDRAITLTAETDWLKHRLGESEASAALEVHTSPPKPPESLTAAAAAAADGHRFHPPPASSAPASTPALPPRRPQHWQDTFSSPGRQPPTVPTFVVGSPSPAT